MPVRLSVCTSSSQLLERTYKMSWSDTSDYNLRTSNRNRMVFTWTNKVAFFPSRLEKFLQMIYCTILPPARPFLTYFMLSSQHALLAWQPHSCMSCKCELVARVHCPRWKVICHCAAVSPPLSQMCLNGSRSILTRTRSSSITVSLTGSGAQGRSHRLRLVLASQPNATFGKRDTNNPACLLACLWHKDTLQDWGFCGCVSESPQARQACYRDRPCCFVIQDTVT